MKQISFENLSALNTDLKKFHKKRGQPLFKRIPANYNDISAVVRERAVQVEKEKWINGYTTPSGIWIPGSGYHFAQEQKIKHRIEGVTDYPMFGFPELVLHTAGDYSYKANKALGVLKGRGFGFSTYGAGCLPNYFSYIYPGCNTGITSIDRAKIKEIFTEKFLATFGSYHKSIRHTVYSRIKGSFLQEYGALIRNNEGLLEEVMGKIEGRETSDTEISVTAFSGSGLKYLFADELPLHKRRDAFVRSAVETMRDRYTKKITGFFLWGGTAEEKLSNEDLFKFKKMYDDKSVIDGNVIFLPFWLTYEPDENGFPNEEKAHQWWESEMERFEKANDTTSAHAHRRTNPRSLDDIFESAKGGYFSSTAEDQIQARITIVSKNTNIVEMATRFVNVGGEISTLKTRTPNQYIIEEPKPNVQYWQLIDGVNTGLKSALAPGRKIKASDRTNNKKSKVASLIIKGADPDSANSYDCVAIYTELPETVEESYQHIENQFRYFNKYDGFRRYEGIEAEASGGVTDSFPAYLSQKGMLEYAMRRKDYSGKRNIDTNRIFQPVTIDTLEFCVRRANPFINKYIGNQNNLRLLTSLLGDAYENNDIRSAWMMLFIALSTDFDSPIKRKDAPARQVFSIKVINGIRTTVWETIGGEKSRNEDWIR